MSQTTPHHTPTLNFYHPAAQEHLLQAAAESGAAVRRGARVTRVQPGTQQLLWWNKTAIPKNSTLALL